jgi:hypothetical protein
MLWTLGGLIKKTLGFFPSPQKMTYTSDGNEVEQLIRTLAYEGLRMFLVGLDHGELVSWQNRQLRLADDLLRHPDWDPWFIVVAQHYSTSSGQPSWHLTLYDLMGITPQGMKAMLEPFQLTGEEIKNAIQRLQTGANADGRLCPPGYYGHVRLGPEELALTHSPHSRRYQPHSLTLGAA